MKKVLSVLIFLAVYGVSFSQTNYQRDSLSKDEVFQKRVRVATIKQANYVLDTASVNAPAYLKNYAQLIISYPYDKWIDAVSYGVISNVGVTLNATDADIEYTVNTLFTRYAKAYYNILN